MKWVILAWWFWTRLAPVTNVINKHLLLVYDKPMIYYALEKLASSWIRDIMIVTWKWQTSSFLELLGSWEYFKMSNWKQIQLSYCIQNEPLWISNWIWLTKNFVGNDNFIVILWDNIFEYDFSSDIVNFKWWCKLFLKEVSDPHRFWIAEFSENKIKNIVEKPLNPPSNMAVVWIYLYDNTAFEKIRWLELSDRWELEVTDLNMCYLKEWNIDYKIIDWFWIDAWTHDSIFLASKYIRDKWII